MALIAYKHKRTLKETVREKEITVDSMKNTFLNTKEKTQEKKIGGVVVTFTNLGMANRGAIEMNPWSSRASKPEHPTWCILDLDPDKGNTFNQVIEVAGTIHQLLEELKVPSYCKTSGSTGLHIYIPLGAKYTYDQSQAFAKWVAAQTDEELAFTSIERMTDNREGRVYIDYLQNRPAATLAAPYSLRPKPGATISMPLAWDEVKAGLDMRAFTMANAIDRIKAKGDIFKSVLGRGIDLKAVLKQLG